MDLESTIVFLIFLLFILYLRNLWNWIQKRRFRKKFKNLKIDADRTNKALSKANDLNYSLNEKVNSLTNESIQLKKYIKETEEKLHETYTKKSKELTEKEENLKYEKEFYKERVKFKEVQAQTTRIGAHFLKNVLFKIQKDLELEKPETFSLFGKNITIENKRSKNVLPTEILHKIYDMLDYNVATIEKSKVPLTSEIEQLDNFIKVVQFLKPLLTISYLKEIEDNELNIYPTLLFPFIENALKHGKLNEEDSKLNIQIHKINKYLIYKVENSVENNKKNKDDNKGFGLQALEKILDIYYPEKEYSKNFNGNTYTATLKIELC